MSHLLSPDVWSYPVPTTFGSAPTHQGSTQTIALPVVVRCNAPNLRERSATRTHALGWKTDRCESFYPAFYALLDGFDSSHLPPELGFRLSDTPALANKRPFNVAAVTNEQSESPNQLLMAVRA